MLLSSSLPPLVSGTMWSGTLASRTIPLAAQSRQSGSACNRRLRCTTARRPRSLGVTTCALELTYCGKLCIRVGMIEVRQTEEFAQWLASLRDDVATKRIKQRIARVQIGLFGDAKSVGDGLSELRIDHGPGYRVYFMRRGDILVILLCGGDKGSQARDISRAKAMAEQLED